MRMVFVRVHWAVPGLLGVLAIKPLAVSRYLTAMPHLAGVQAFA